MSAAQAVAPSKPVKAAPAEETAAKEFLARHRFAHITARKARYVADLIRGRSVNQALELLQFTPNRGATFYLKVLRSAIANASMDENVNINRLVISECRADDGPMLQDRLRWRAGPQGRAMPFAKKLSHLTVRVREDGDAPASRQSPAKGTSSAKAPAETGAAAPESKAESKGAKKPARAKKPKSKPKEKA